MKVVILCGGQGTRIRDVSDILPKPMLPVGGKPILWHIMKIYAQHGFKDFILCLGYKGWVIKEYFLNYRAKNSDFTINLGSKDVSYHSQNDESDWNVTCIDTGEASQTAARLWNVREYLKNTDTFCVTYGDGVADINITELVEEHKNSKRLLTITGVKPLGRFGEIEVEGGTIKEFNEKPNVSTGIINGGFMVFRKKAIEKYFSGQVDQSLEADVIPHIVKDKQAGVFQNHRKWKCIDIHREYTQLNRIWDAKKKKKKKW
ncbi:MAG: NTP transferase domain-containing protein [Candidatus Omnitrophica bacterium]|nr:NTP transferase domain-containing protein [Candidatus Omnitrophota bacterium]